MACADPGSFSSEFGVTLELPIYGCQPQITENMIKLFNEPFPFLIVEHSVL